MKTIKNYEYYNIYSLKNYINFLKKMVTKKILLWNLIYQKWWEKKNPIKMGTYTIKDVKQLIQLSGPLKMNWYFILSKKK